MSAQIKRIVLRTPASVGGQGQYTALRQCRDHAVNARADRTAADASADAARLSAAAAQAASDHAAASAGAVKVSVADVRAKVLAEAVDARAPVVATVENPGGDERLALRVETFAGAEGGQAGSAGTVPAPAADDRAKYLRGDATWQPLTVESLGIGLVENAPAVDRRIAAAKGDLLAARGAGEFARLPAGANGQVLVADDRQDCGLRYASVTGGGWTNLDAAFTRTADGAFTVADTETAQAVFVAGRPIRYRANSGAAWRYGVVAAYADGAVTLAGAPLIAAIGGDAGRAMQYADMTRLAQETFQIAGRFATVATSSALADYLLLNFVWLRGAAHCVGFRARPLADDSGAAQPRVNVVCNGGLVCTANAGAGLAVSDAAWTATGVDVDAANCAVGFGQPLELAVDANGTNDDARDLTVVVSLVLE